MTDSKHNPIDRQRPSTRNSALSLPAHQATCVLDNERPLQPKGNSRDEALRAHAPLGDTLLQRTHSRASSMSQFRKPAQALFKHHAPWHGFSRTHNCNDYKRRSRSAPFWRAGEPKKLQSSCLQYHRTLKDQLECGGLYDVSVGRGWFEWVVNPSAVPFARSWWRRAREG